MQGTRLSPSVIAAFLAIYLLWGSTYLAVALALRSIPPFALMGTRSIIGGAVLLLFALARGAKVTPASWGFAAICGMLFFVGCHGVLAYAQQRVPSGFAALLLATIPFWIAIGNAILPGNERHQLRALIMLLPGFAGVAAIAWHQIGTGAAVSDTLLLLGAAASWAAGTLLSERNANPASPLAFSGQGLLVGGAALLAISAIAGEMHTMSVAAISAVSLAGWAYLTFAGTIIAFAAYIWLLNQVSPTLVATYTFVNPIIAVLLGWLVLHETLTVWTLLGATLVIGSVSALLITGQPRR